jgi:hypothetical protein
MNRLTKVALVAAFAAALTTLARADNGHDHDRYHDQDHGHASAPSDSPLVAKVYKAVQRFKDINVAMGEGWVQGTPCVSGPDHGAMGVHFILPERVQKAVLKAEEPEALIYEPLENGYFQLVGVEFIILADVWQANNSSDGTPAGPPALEGHLLNYIGMPNRYGLPPFFEIHVWAFEHNPNGSFADWNNRVTCENQRLSTP